MRVLICGDRTWRDPKLIYRVMHPLNKDEDTVIEGEAHGADEIARIICDLRDIPYEPYPADWCDFSGSCQKLHTHHGKRAGLVRNQKMLDANPDEVWAFHDDLSKSRGTIQMVRLAVAKGVETKWFSHGKPTGVDVDETFLQTIGRWKP